MPKVIRYNNTANRDASVVAKKDQARTIYADALVAEKTLNKGCLNRVVAGPAATTSFSAMKITDQSLGAVFTTPLQQAAIVENSPCETVAQPVPIVYPNYELSCSDPQGIQIMATGVFTSFTFTTRSQGAGVIEFQFFLHPGDLLPIGVQLVVLGVDSTLITPPSGITQIGYVFKCNPTEITLYCANPEMVLQWTAPFSFFNPPGYETPQELTLYKHPIESGITETHTVGIGETFTPTPAWGWDFATIPC